MVRLADFPGWEREHLLAKTRDLTGFEDRPWQRPPPLERCCVAIVTTAGLHRKGDAAFVCDDVRAC